MDFSDGILGRGILLIHNVKFSNSPHEGTTGTGEVSQVFTCTFITFIRSLLSLLVNKPQNSECITLLQEESKCLKVSAIDQPDMCFLRESRGTEDGHALALPPS